MSKKEVEYSREEMEQFKQDIADYHTLKNMNKEQKAELLLFYIEQLGGVKQLSELWGVKNQTVHNMRHYLKKAGYINDDLTLVQEEKKKEKESAPHSEVLAEKEEWKLEDFQMQALADIPDQHIEPSGNDVYRIEGNNITRRSSNQEMMESDMSVSLDSFMKILELQERMAKRIEEQSQEQKYDGFRFDFKGLFNSKDLAKRLNKILVMIEDEPNKYQVKFELVEVEQEEEEDATNKEVHTNELLEEVNSLQDNVKTMKEQMEKTWARGYNTFKTNKKGLHHVRSEYENNGDFNGVIERDGKKYYQTFYICPDCNHKGKHYLENHIIYCNCSECGKRMRTRGAVDDKSFQQDSFGNYFIGGKFKREEELDQDKYSFEKMYV